MKKSRLWKLEEAAAVQASGREDAEVEAEVQRFHAMIAEQSQRKPADPPLTDEQVAELVEMLKRAFKERVEEIRRLEEDR